MKYDKKVNFEEGKIGQNFDFLAHSGGWNLHSKLCVF
jgi:hypothetical protein